MKKYKLIILAIAFSFLISGCTDNFFDLEPNDKVSANKVYKTASDFNLAAMGLYAKLQTQMSYYTEMCEYRSDNLWLNAPTTGTQDRYDIDQFKDKASNDIIYSAWANFNNGVYRCNLILDKIDGASFDATLKKQYKGEALFIRAFTYLNMYRAWGGVPVTDRVVSVEEALGIGRASDEKMYEFLVRDLKTIVDGNLLPDNYSATNAGRVTMGAAKAMLGKVYLTFHKWPEARDILSELIDKYQLLDNLSDVFDVSKKLNAEIIFAICYNKLLVGEGHGAWYSVANQNDDKNQTGAMINCFESGDRRVDMISYRSASSTLWVLNKFYDTLDATTKKMTGNDFIVLRYADVLLMYAEALNEIGYSDSQESLALKAMNSVRTRAINSEIKVATLPNQEIFRKAIMLERQREFPYEGQRWFDLVRMGGAIEAMKADGRVIQQWQLLFPIPQKEIERINNKALLWQNPGYN